MLRTLFTRLLTVAALCCIPCAAAFASWIDDFEGYPSAYTGIPSPWEDSASQCAYTGLGVGGGMGSCGPGYNWDWGSAFRRTMGGNVMIARLRLDPPNTYQGIKIGIVRDKTVWASNKSFAGNDNAYLTFYADEKGNAILALAVDDYKDGTCVGGLRNEVTGLSPGVWYDVRMTVAGREVTAEYKPSDGKQWVKVGELTAYDGFVPNYLALSAVRGGFVDDVGFGTKAFFDEYERTKRSP